MLLGVQYNCEHGIDLPGSAKIEKRAPRLSFLLLDQLIGWIRKIARPVSEHPNYYPTKGQHNKIILQLRKIEGFSIRQVEMADYGVSSEKFWINTIVKPEDDPFYKTLNRQRGEKITLVNQGQIDIQRAEYDKQVGIIGHSGEMQKQRMEADTHRYEQEQLGFTYQQKEGFEVMKRIAENEGSRSDL